MATSPMNSPDRSADREMTHNHKGISIPGAPAHPLEDENILGDILFRLPPLPSSLPRASPVSKLWHRVVSDPHFHRRFRAHHKKAPLLGFFYDNDRRINFMSALDPPNCIPTSSCFSSLPRQEGVTILECRHGLVLFFSFKQRHFVVWDPITGDHHDLAVPPSFDKSCAFVANGAVVRAARENGHVLGDWHSDPFQVVFLGWNRERIFACIYSSEAGTWGNLISLQQPHHLHVLTVSPDCQSSLVQDSLYWVPLVGGHSGILKFDLHRQTLAVIDLPSDDSFNFSTIHRGTQIFVMPSDASDLTLIILVDFSVHVWKMVTNDQGVSRWVLKNTVELSDHLSLKPRSDAINVQWPLRILGVDEDNKVMFKMSDSGVIYMVHLETLQFKVLPKKMEYGAHPFMSFYTPGTHIDRAGNDEEENVTKAQNGCGQICNRAVLIIDKVPRACSTCPDEEMAFRNTMKPTFRNSLLLLIIIPFIVSYFIANTQFA